MTQVKRMGRAPTSLGRRRFWHAFFVVMQFSFRSVSLRKASWFGTLVFAGCLLILYPFAFGSEVIQKGEVRHGAFWAINEFVVALTVGRLFVSEQEGGALEFLLASRTPRSAVLVGKMAFTALQLFTLQVPLTVLWIVFYNVPTESVSALVKVLLPVCVLFNLGTASLGSLITCITARSAAREILVPILFYPLQTSVLLAAVTLCARSDPGLALVGGFSAQAWWTVLAGFPVVFTALGFMLDNALLQE